MLQSKIQLSEDDESVPDVPAAIQELLATIFTALYNHQDEEGRCYSDSMAELPEHDIVDGKKYECTLDSLNSVFFFLESSIYGFLKYIIQKIFMQKIGYEDCHWT